MLSITIDRFKARYRIPAAALREQPRLQRIVDDALARVLDGAIEREGIGRSGHVCVRDVDAVATLRLRQPDSALAASLGDAIALAIRKKLEDGSSSVVQYGSRVHALIDLASSATAGDFSRSWAWVQLGIWRSDFPLRADVAAELVLRALGREPTHAAAVVAYLARERADRFRDLIARATPGAWAALARAAIVAAGGAGHVPLRVAETAAGAREAIDAEWRTAASQPLARRVVTHAAIARASIDRFASVPGELRGALAALALLEVEPSAVRGGDIAQWLPAIERAMTLAATPATVRLPDARDGETQTADAPQDLSAVAQSAKADGARFGETAPALDAGDPSKLDARALPRAVDERTQDDRHAVVEADLQVGLPATGADALRAARRERPPIDDRRGARVDGEPAGQSRTTDRATDERTPHSADRAVEAVPDVRGLTRTRHGGLLYLVNLLPRMGLIETMGGDERWFDRGPRWVLHQLAMALAAIEPEDPAALVFAGLMPGAPPPSSLQDPPTDVERAALDTLRAAITHALRDALGGVPESDSNSESDSKADRSLLDHVCRRPAQIVAEPGWIEARFALEDVSLDIRRAGLDRDPDWVPWLGIVVRFIYG
jgi:hypothetical protein